MFGMKEESLIKVVRFLIIIAVVIYTFKSCNEALTMKAAMHDVTVQQAIQKGCSQIIENGVILWKCEPKDK